MMEQHESDFCHVDFVLCTYVVVKLSRLVKLSSLVKCESRKSQLLPLDTLCVCCHRIQKVVLHKYPYGHVVSLSWNFQNMWKSLSSSISNGCFYHCAPVLPYSMESFAWQIYCINMISCEYIYTNILVFHDLFPSSDSCNKCESPGEAVQATVAHSPNQLQCYAHIYPQAPVLIALWFLYLLWNFQDMWKS